jgi:hypothetical protein
LLAQSPYPVLPCRLKITVSLERFGPISRFAARAPGGDGARALARLRACLGLPSASAPGFVDRARPARDDVARLGVARPRSASSRPIHGVRSDGSAGDPVVPNRVVLHLGNADALCRPTAARYRPPLPAQFRPDARRERTLVARATTWSMREMFRNESSCANLNHVCCVELFGAVQRKKSRADRHSGVPPG